jgi:hypothetical protein
VRNSFSLLCLVWNPQKNLTIADLDQNPDHLEIESFKIKGALKRKVSEENLSATNLFHFSIFALKKAPRGAFFISYN